MSTVMVNKLAIRPRTRQYPLSIQFKSQKAPSELFTALYNFLSICCCEDRRIYASIMFCPSTFIKSDITLTILSTNLQNATPLGAAPPPPRLAGFLYRSVVQVLNVHHSILNWLTIAL